MSDDEHENSRGKIPELVIHRVEGLSPFFFEKTIFPIQTPASQFYSLPSISIYSTIFRARFLNDLYIFHISPPFFL